jgi:hypothetical protein
MFEQYFLAKIKNLTYFKIMKYALHIFTVIALTFSIIYAGAIIQSFEIESNNGNIILTWQSSTEQNVKQYEILRGPDKDRLTLIATVPAKGDNSLYTYIDENAYKASDSFYAYGLVIRDNDGSKSEIMHTRILHENVSSVKRTWGSIKALFR